MDKHDQRRASRAERAALDPGQRMRAARSAAETLLALPEVATAQRVLVYAAYGDELDTEGLIHALLERGTQVLLPRVVGDDLDLVPLDTDDALRPGYRGVMEPTGPATLDLAVDVAVVPGVAFDRLGGRLGQGGGHYDRLLARLPEETVRIGLAFEAQVTERLPREDHDLPVDVLVTEEGAHRTGAR